MFGFLFGLAVGAAAASGEDANSYGNSAIIWQAEDIAGKKYDPLKLGRCTTGGGDLAKAYEECFEKYSSFKDSKSADWSILRIEMRADGYLVWTLYRKGGAS